ncbi:8051_t:CDS:2 [Racocetra persica]|uniref:8051_t:CDS:1 n=1 Tax=Racocetra persica TaxID=160502 RepID=A0ACA9KDP7_9GLOM|nr:8051_t:CDS:2 [Racocetra persica]
MSKKYPVYVEFYSIYYSIPIIQQKGHDKYINEEVKKNPRQMIFQNIHSLLGLVWEMLAIIGLSGCEKTIFLNVLEDRTSKKNVEGTVKLNRHIPTKVSRHFVAYCTQDDIFFPYLISQLRLPHELPTSAKLEQVENIIQALNLSKYSNTKIGDTRIHEISGGERKQVSIANELLTDPSVILLDKPTSGLDMYSSLVLDLVQTLKEFAIKQKKTIIMVIHQPASQVFDLFDKLLLIADGQVAYFGDSKNIVDYLADEGFGISPVASLS